MLELHRLYALIPVLALSACATAEGPAAGQSAAQGSRASAARSAARDAESEHVARIEVERRAARLELQVWERDAEIDELRGKLDNALQEVVRAMAKLQSLATRAEAASAMAEADLALQSIKGANRESPESRQAAAFQEQSVVEFRRENYGGALYLANQARAAARAPQIAGGELTNPRSGETPFAARIQLRATGRANMRDGPGTGFAVVTAVESGAALTGLSYLGDWLRVADEAGHQGWISRALVAKR
jgi:uncharacterized protein YgiM (DUF1202 family)